MAQSRLARNPGDDLVEEEEHEFFWTLRADELHLGPAFGFTAGHTLGINSKWRFDCIPGKMVRRPNLAVKLVECDQPGDIYAKMDISLSDGPQIWNSWKCDLDYRSFTMDNNVICNFSEFNRMAPTQSLGSVAYDFFHNTFTLQIEVKIRVKGIAVAKRGDSARFKYSNIPKSTMLSMLENRDDNADVTFKTKDGQEIVAHRNILSAQSDVFKTMFATEMTEKKKGVVKLADLSGPGFRIFLKFVYTGELDEKWGDYWDEVINAAGKYQVAPLTDVCDILLPSLITWDNCVELLDVAELHGLSRAEAKIQRFMKSDPDKMFRVLRGGPPPAKKGRPNV